MVEFRLRSGNAVLLGCLLVWGIGGLGLSVVAGIGAPILTGIYVTLLWIGGCAFFGILAILSEGKLRLIGPSVPVYVTKPPRADGLNEEYKGVPYMRLESGQVIAEFADGKHTFGNWKQFTQTFPT
jgi:hypothetical protein